ncbi:MAG: argininosuccinate lyase [Flavobacteriaceae bacterium]|nr:MAG: argininosuccinate lyase [Flavobacteriaceae bacterium]
MKLWEKGYSVNQKIEKFTIGKDRILDMYLAKHDVLGNMAQTKMLAKVGIISKEEETDLLKGLEELLEQIKAGTFEIEDHFEDVHSKIEVYLTQKYGEAGKKIHTARSRNDQVLTAIQLFFKEYIVELAAQTKALMDVLMQKADQHKAVLLPGYTHFQAAMPSSFGLWFSAYAEHLLLDLQFLQGAFHIADQNPLGSAAGFGSSFPIDREFTTKEMGFSNVLVSSVSAQMLRGKTEKSLAFAMAQIAGTISKMASDLVMYNSQEMGFVKLPKELTTGSSIMPHKKNPDVFELTRAHCNLIQGVPSTLVIATNNLPSGYHRDFQVLKEILFEPMTSLLDILSINVFAIENMQINSGYMDNPKYDAIFTVENINELIKSGVPFRDAYKKVGESWENGTYKPQKDFRTTHLGSIHNPGIETLTKKIEDFVGSSVLFAG